MFDTHHSLVDDYCCFNIFDCFPHVPAVPSILYSVPQVSAAFFDVPTDSCAFSEGPPEFRAYLDTPSISGTRSVGPCTVGHSRNMFLASVAVHPPFEVSRVSTAFVRLGASLENHVRMFLLKKSREARSCSYLGCPCTYLRYSTSKVSNVTKTF
jgi:hypothetical protein